MQNITIQDFINSANNNIIWKNYNESYIPKLPFDTLYSSSLLEPNINLPTRSSSCTGLVVPMPTYPNEPVPLPLIEPSTVRAVVGFSFPIPIYESVPPAAIRYKAGLLLVPKANVFVL